MSKPKSLTNDAGEVRELRASDLKKFRKASDVLPKTLQLKLGVRGPQKSPTKQRITIRLSPEVIEPFRETGAGWQTRMDQALKDWLRTHSPANA
jgi:uncharacterized protein (DUF4415 family)